MKMALEYEDDIVVKDSLSGSSNDNNLVSNGILRLLSGNTLDLNQMKRDIHDQKVIQNATFVD